MGFPELYKTEHPDCIKLNTRDTQLFPKETVEITGR
jgi:hypothetical protein